MSLIYDENIFAKFRELAVTDVNDLVIDKTYYSNCWDGGRVLIDILTKSEYYSSRGLEWPYSNGDKLGWMVFKCETGKITNVCSLSDNNVGSSYNPWLIFDDEDTATRCNNELKVEGDRDDVMRRSMRVAKIRVRIKRRLRQNGFTPHWNATIPELHNMLVELKKMENT